MSKKDKLIEKFKKKPPPSDFTIGDVITVMEYLGYRLERIKGSHHIFEKEGYDPLVVPDHSHIKKAYIKKIRAIIIEFEEDSTNE